MGEQIVCRTAELDGAILAINFKGKASFLLARLLRAIGVPLVFATGYGAEIVPENPAGMLLFEKPVDHRATIWWRSRCARRSTPPWEAKRLEDV